VSSAPARPGERWSIDAPAKINPFLAVLGRRADGYHELATWMVALELADRLEGGLDAGGAPGSVALEVVGPAASADVPRDERNLVVRAARLALARSAELAGAPAPALWLRLSKQVPSRAGLGGGSSDAAAALRLVEALAGCDLGSAWRRSCLAELGSDTVFFDAARGSGAGLCTGRGERVEPAPTPDPEWWVALLTPDVECPTGDIFRALAAPPLEKGPSPFPHPPPPLRSWLRVGAARARAHLHNPLEAAALAAIPTLRPWRDVLAAAGEHAFRLTGSGSSFFAIFEGAHEAALALGGVVEEARRRSLAWRGRWVTRTRSFTGDPVRVSP